MKTAEWLRIYVYDRVQDPKSNTPRYLVSIVSCLTNYCSGYAMLVTNTISAFWHGFYPGYYLAFGFASFIIEEMRMCRATIR
jgi:lysophospholipid acyltransferase